MRHSESEKIRARYIALFGLAIRELLSFWTAHPFDFEIWIRLGYYVSKGFDPYRMTSAIPGLSIPGTGTLPSIGYPPLWALMQAIVYDFYSFVGFDDRFFYYLLIKQETIIPDIIVGLLLYRIITRYGRTADAGKALAFWMLCPFVVVISSVWGMFDQLALMIVLTAVLLAPKAFPSSIAGGLAVFLKALPLIFVPALAWRQGSRTKKALYLLAAICLAGALTVTPYLFFRDWSIGALLSTGASVTSTPTNSLNYWVIAYVLYAYSALPSYADSFVNLMGFAWIFALALAYLVCLKGPVGRGISSRYMILVLQFVTVVFLLTRVGVAEQYVIYFIGFGLLERYMVGGVTPSLFNGVWISSLGYLFANNTYMIRFVAPLSARFSSLDITLSSGSFGELRYALMIGTALVFTAYCVMYLRSLYRVLARQRLEESRTGVQGL